MTKIFVSFLNHAGNLTTSVVFNKLKQADEVWDNKEHVIDIVPQPSGSTKGKGARFFLDEAVLGTITGIPSEWIKKN